MMTIKYLLILTMKLNKRKSQKDFPFVVFFTKVPPPPPRKKIFDFVTFVENNFDIMVLFSFKKSSKLWIFDQFLKKRKNFPKRKFCQKTNKIKIYLVFLYEIIKTIEI